MSGLQGIAYRESPALARLRVMLGRISFLIQSAPQFPVGKP
jgi:hypothetical protein